MALIGLAVYGFVSNGLLKQELWIEHGLRRFVLLALAFAVATTLCAISRIRYFRLVYGVAFAATFWAIDGGGALMSAVLCVLSFLGVGDLVLGRRRDRTNVPYDGVLAMSLGAVFYIAVFEYTARSRVHYAFLYLAVLLGSLAVNWRGLEYWFSRIRTWAFPATTISKAELALEAGIGFFLFFYMMLVAKPETGADALVEHLTLPAMMANAHRFNFDFHHYVWSFVPMGSDWLYSLAYGIGGEFAARLLNFSFLCGITLLLVGLLKGVTKSRLLTLFCTLLWVSTPLVQLVTSSLYSENLIALLSIAAFASVCAYQKTLDKRYLLAFVISTAGALASKTGAISFFIPLLPWAVWVFVRSQKHNPRSLTWSDTAVAIVLFFVIASPQYVRAWQHTHNPFFPYMNELFKSPYFFPWKLESRFPGTINPTTLYKITFGGGNLEASKGYFGFHYVLFIPLILVTFKRSWPVIARASIALSLIFVWLSLAFIAYARYLYAGLPLVLIASAAMFCEVRNRDKALHAVLLSLGTCCLVLNAYFVPAASWNQREGFLDPTHEDVATLEYLTRISPYRLVVDYLNVKARGAKVGFLDVGFQAGFKGTAYCNDWHDFAMYEELRQAPTPGALAARLAAEGFEYFVGPVPSQMSADAPALQSFATTYLSPEYAIGPVMVYHWSTYPAR